MIDLTNVFQSGVDREFEFLVKEYGYRQRKEESHSIWYESDKVRVLLFYDSSRYDFDFGIDRISDKKDWVRNSYQMQMLQRFAGIDNPEGPNIENEGDLKRWIKQFAKDLKTYGHRALIGDEVFYEKLSEWRMNRRQELRRQINLKSDMV